MLQLFGFHQIGKWNKEMSISIMTNIDLVMLIMVVISLYDD